MKLRTYLLVAPLAIFLAFLTHTQASYLSAWQPLSMAVANQAESRAAVRTSSGGILVIERREKYPESNSLGTLGACLLSLIKDSDAFGMEVAPEEVSTANLTIYFLQAQALSVEDFVENAHSLCLTAVEGFPYGDNMLAGEALVYREEATTTERWRYVVASLIVDGVFLLLLISLFLTCAKGDDTAEYQYEADGAPEVSQQDSWTAPLSQGLTRRKSLISLVSVEDLPTSPRLLYPHTLKRSRQGQSTISLTSTLASVAISEADESSPTRDTDRAEAEIIRSTSIFSHPSISVMWKASVPILIAATIAFYLSGQFAGGVLIELNIFVRGKPLIVAPISDFDLVTSVENMLAAEVYPMAIITIIWSGVWPYLRQILLLFCWFAPTTIFSLRRRAALIHLLDICGKWCLLNLFMSTMMGVAFAFNVSTDTIAILNKLLPKDFLHCTILLKQQYGTYGSIIGTALSLVAGHITIHFHRCTLAADAAVDYHCNVKPQRRQQILRQLSLSCEPTGGNFDDESGDRILSDVNSPLVQSSVLHSTAATVVTSWLEYGSTDEFVRESVRTHFRKCNGRQLRLCDEVCILVLLPLTVVFLIYGLFGISFSFEFGGLLAKILRFVEPSEVSSSHSIVSIILASGKSGDIGAKCVQAFLMVMTVVFPFLHVLLLAILWFIPLTLRHQKLLYMLQEMCAAWVSIDVFLLSIVSGVLQISKFTEWMVGKNCPRKLHCFAVDSSFEPDAWAVFVAVLLWYSIDYLINKKADHAILHRERLVESVVNMDI